MLSIKPKHSKTSSYSFFSHNEIMWLCNLSSEDPFFLQMYCSFVETVISFSSLELQWLRLDGVSFKRPVLAATILCEGMIFFFLLICSVTASRNTPFPVFNGAQVSEAPVFTLSHLVCVLAGLGGTLQVSGYSCFCVRGSSLALWSE